MERATSGEPARTAARGSEAGTPSTTPRTPGSSPGGISAPPSISLPKGGGAIRGIGEKFAANPVTGTASMTVPIATSPGRSGFGPQLSLSYDSGSGNGPFGFGSSLSSPAITRKTAKGMPRYGDAEDSDVFVLSGAEDLVPVLVHGPEGTWRLEDLPPRTVDGVTYRVRRYRPRIEGLFARIERWTNMGDAADAFWRSISSDNVTTWYGRTVDSRVADPADPRHIFSWLICQSHDDKGNVIVYGYKAEDSARILEDASGDTLVKAHERNRTTASRSAQRYLKRIRYGNRSPYFPGLRETAPWPEPPDAEAADGSDAWHFEVVFDYGEHDPIAPTPREAGEWPARPDPFSSYRSGFEVRTYRTCQRVLMFHHFPDEADVGRDCLVRSTDLTYSDEVDPTDVRNPVYAFLRSVTQTGYRRGDVGYVSRSLPPVEFEYTEPVVQELVEEVDPGSLENLPVGLDGSSYDWTDLHGEGVPGMLSEQAGAWFYKRNLSPLSPLLPDGREQGAARFAPLETVAVRPAVTVGGGAEFMDLAGDGQPDLVMFADPTPGLYEHDEAEGWLPFRPFTSHLTRNATDPNVRFVDLDGDGNADVLITEGDALLWHASLAETGFGPEQRVAQAFDEEKGPRVVFADGTESIHVADLSGDGLLDIARVRNGEVCYWPNLGYGRFGAKVTMDNPPWFDNPDLFDQRRIRLADIDGSGTTDIVYLHRDGVRLYFNQSGNSWSRERALRVFPRVDDLARIVPVDLLGNGTACLVWSSSLPSDAPRPMRYVNLMGGIKPHLLVKSVNNLGAETEVRYRPSTAFYLADKRDGRPWVSRLPFPVHVVDRIVTHDRISGNRFITRYAYHHGYFDGIEREFRGFGMVEQWDTEEFAALQADGQAPTGTNIDASSHVPPVLTRTWFHTGMDRGRNHVSDFFAGLLNANDIGEYYREPGLSDAQARALLLDDTVLPDGLTDDEEREACRALKGSMLRREVYAQDGTDAVDHPYAVTEQNFSIRRLQARGPNRHAVFLSHARESISYQYDRRPTDPRIGHALTLEVDGFGNVLKSAAIGYGRRRSDPTLAPADQARQAQVLITWTENRVTNTIDSADGHRTPLPCESRTYELAGLSLAAGQDRYPFDEVLEAGITSAAVDYEEQPPAGQLAKRLIEHARTYYRRDDLSGVLELGALQSQALPFESYQLAFTPGLVAKAYGAHVADAMLDGTGETAGGRYVHTEDDGTWWIPSGKTFYSPEPAHIAAQELAAAREHFFLPQRYRDPFHTDAVSTESFVSYDRYDLLLEETRDALGNRVTVGERNVDPMQPLVRRGQDYRVLQPALVMDPNRNRSAVAFDALGMVVGTAIMGKVAPAADEGDSLIGFSADLNQADLDQFLGDPKGPMTATLLADATTRIVYDLTAYWREPDRAKKSLAFAATLSRETHKTDLQAGQQTKLQASLSYSDGFGREIQKKIQAEAGPVPQRDAHGRIIVGGDGQPVMTPADVSRRWLGSGWTVFNNKGKPVRQYEPFFSDTHRFEFDVRVGISPVLFYDAVERVVATLHPNHTWEKVVFDPWRQETWDVNDTVLNEDPGTDSDVGAYFRRLPDADYRPTWHALRSDAANAVAFAARYPDATDRAHETRAAEKTGVHAATPTVAHADSLGRTFFTVAHNKAKNSDPAQPLVEEFHSTRIVLDIEGNQREVIDSNDRVIMRYDYDMLGNPIHQASMEAGERWMLNDVAGKSLYAWDSRDHRFRTSYDPLQRPTDSLLSEGGGAEIVVGRSTYGEGRRDAEDDNLRGKVVEINDQAGVVTNARYDFKGNPLRSQRRLARDYRTTLDWSGPVPLESETYTTRTRYDALNRPAQRIAPHSDQPGAEVNVVQAIYNDANLLEQLHAWLSQDAEPAGLLDPASANLHAVTDVDYDAKGQRVLIQFGNGAATRYTYDPLNLRLTHLLTRRESASFPGDCPQSPATSWLGCQVQNLHYTYDPAGNITHIRDDSQQTIYFKNTRVEPSAEYTYDAINRLIEATGREHLGQIGGAPTPYPDDDAVGVRLQHPADGNAMGRYRERYVYDAVGNVLSMQHRGSDPAHPGWTRTYDFQETSQLEPGKVSNRLSSTTTGGATETFSTAGDGYLAHGNMLRMSHLQVMQWDFRDQLQMIQRQKVNDADADSARRPGETTWYVYDSAGQRVRKVWEKAPGLTEERIYLGGFEIFRRRKIIDGAETSMLERETLHVMDDTGRLALVETRTLDVAGEDKAPKRLIRYQFGNHLGSTSLELDDRARIISYEEYTPFGASTYQAVRSQTETAKRYRYTGKERDEESGFYYHGARYYVPWLGRWTTADPDGTVDGVNLFAYGRNNPLTYSDSTGTQCDPTMQSCIDPTAPTAREEALQQSLPENERSLPPPGPVGASVGLSALGGLLNSAVPPTAVGAGIPLAAPGTDWAAEAAQARQAYRAANVMLPGTQVQHWTKELSAAATSMDPAVMNLNLSPLQSSGRAAGPWSATSVGPATTLLTDPAGGQTRYTILGGSVYGNEHKFADQFLIPEIENQIRAANPGASPAEVSELAGRQARWIMTGEPGPSAVPSVQGMGGGARWLAGGAGALNLAGGGLMLLSVDPEHDPALVTAGKVTSGSASVVGGGMQIGGALLGEAGLVEVGAAASGVGLVIAVPIMVYEMRPRGWIATDPVLMQQAMERRARGENVNPFCAQCHGPRGALDPNNDWNAGGARRAAFQQRLQWQYLGD